MASWAAGRPGATMNVQYAAAGIAARGENPFTAGRLAMAQFGGQLNSFTEPVHVFSQRHQPRLAAQAFRGLSQLADAPQHFPVGLAGCCLLYRVIIPVQMRQILKTEQQECCDNNKHDDGKNNPEHGSSVCYWPRESGRTMLQIILADLSRFCLERSQKESRVANCLSGARHNRGPYCGWFV